MRRLLLLVFSALMLALPTSATGGSAATAGSKAAGGGGFGPIVRESGRNDTSGPLKNIPIVEDAAGNKTLPTFKLPRIRQPKDGDRGPDAALDTQAALGAMPPTDANFEGVNNVDGVLPPDTNGDVNATHYVQMVNLSFAIFERDGTLVYGPAPSNTIWSGFGGICESSNNGDPIVLWDHLSRRWLLSQFAFPDVTTGPFYECVAISTTEDPTGSYHRYEFLISETKLDDYPKFGVWPDAYYMAVNQFEAPDLNFAGQGAVAFERAKMLQGLPARMVYFDLESANPNFGGQLPSELDGPPPPAGAPNYFVEVDDGGGSLGPPDALRLWEFRVDWSNPLASTFGVNGQPNRTIPVAEFSYLPCVSTPLSVNPARNCIPQPSGPPLDAVGDRLMWRLQYRNFGSYETLVVNHTVDADGLGKAGVRWYELRKTDDWAIHQQSTYSPDAVNRWMASAAMDNDGNIAVGYSVSSSTVFPGIRYAGRLASDPPNSLPQTEASVIEGTTSQAFPIARWGDYSNLAVDPTDDCTFWYTTEYYRAVGEAPWQTRVGSFRFPSCTPPPTGRLTGRVRDAATGAPLVNAIVTAGAYTAFTRPDGRYDFGELPPGTYDVTASAFGHQSSTRTGVVVRADRTTTVNFQLAELATNVTLTGRVTDGSGHGWGLYARIDVVGYPGGPLFTSPFTGAYSVRLEPGDYVLNVQHARGGYVPKSVPISVSGSSGPVDIMLTADTESCPPGYRTVGVAYEESFDGGETPAGWQVVDNIGNGEVWRFDDPGGRTNLTGGQGGFATVDSDFYGTLGVQDTELISPRMDFSTVSEVNVEFNTDFRWFNGGLDEKADVDVSVDDGATWTNVWRRQGASDRGPKREVVDVSSLAGGQPDVRVRFHYYDANFEWWWQVDEVLVGSRSCELIRGGLVVGRVRNEAGNPVVPATVRSVKAPSESATTFLTPDDKARDGLYILFSSHTGRLSFTAEAAGYLPTTQRTTVVADAVARRDFILRAG